MTKRHDPNFIKNTIESENWVLHGTYKNANSKMRATCNKGHETFVTWSGWQRGARCKHCAGQYMDTALAKKALSKEGWVLHNEYKNAYGILSVTCPKGHNLDIKWCNWKKGCRCRYCAGQVITHDDVQNAFESRGFTLLSNYVNSNSKMDMICPQGHRHTITWASFRNGVGCGVCDGKYKTQSEISTLFSNEGYTLTSVYKNNRTKVEFICPNGHYHAITLNDWNSCKRCAYCAITGFNPDKSASIYYLRFDIDGVYYYKIGITNRTIKERYRDEPLPYTILYENRYLLGSLAKQDEAAILKKHKKHLYKGPPLLFSGNTELFTRDVLKLDQNAKSKHCCC